MFSGLYWLYLMLWAALARRGRDEALDPPARRQLARPDAARRCRAARVAAQRPGDHRRSAVVADEHPPHRATRSTASPASRNVPEYIPRRIGEILRPPVLAGRRARRRAVAAVAAPPRARRGGRGRARRASCSRPSPPPGCRSTRATRSSRRRSCACSAAPACSAGRAWSAAIRGGAGGWPAGRSCSWRCSPTRPSQYRSAHRELDKLARQQSIEDDLLALVDDRSITLALRAGGRAQPRADPAARAVPEDEPARTSSAPRSSRSPRASTSTRRARRSKQTTCLTRTTPTCRSACRRASPRCTPTARGSIFQRCVRPMSRPRSSMDRAPLVETPHTGRRSPPATPVRELPLRLPGIA